MKNFEDLDIQKFYSGKEFIKYIHEKRFIKNDLKQSDLFYQIDDDKGLGLEEILKENQHIVLLGHPGIGKTKELQYLFLKLWNEKSKSGIIPFFLNIRNFRTTTKFEELIKYKNWKDFENIYLFIDGLDEIPNIQDFISALENFIGDNEDKNFNIVISCRTNIYEKYIVEIQSFKYFCLDNLNDYQIKSILKNNFDISISIQDLNKFRIFLENPFNLNLFGDFYKEHGKFPDTISEAFELSINKELNLLNKEKFAKSEIIDTVHVRNILEKIAFTNELMQRNFILEEDLYAMIGKVEKGDFEKISFIEKIPDTKMYIFRHQNYQEFLAAEYLSNLDADKIIELIKIEGVNKTKPALFNTISFLLNILDGSKFKQIKDWLIHNEPEILFLAEPERIDPQLRRDTFIKYFDETSIQKTFWIGKNNRFSLERISKFGDIDHLLEIVNNEKNIFRTKTSAYTILSLAELGDKRDSVKQIIEEKLLSLEEEEKMVHEILRVAKSQKLHINYPGFFEKIADFYKESYDPEINHQIISMLNDFENVDYYFPVLSNCLSKLYEIKPERVHDNTIRGTNWILEKLIIRVQDNDNFTQIIRILFDSKFDFSLNDFYDKNFQFEFFEKIERICERDKTFLVRLINLLLVCDRHIFYRENMIIKLLNESEDKNLVFKNLLEKYGISNTVIRVLQITFTEENLDYLSELYPRKAIKFSDNLTLESFRNYISHTNFELAHKLEQRLLQIGYTFDKPLTTFEEKEQNNRRIEKHRQNNWNILFEKEKLLQEIEKVFIENQLEEISWEQICDITHKRSDHEDFYYLENPGEIAISDIIRNNDTQTFASIKNIIKADYVLLSLIKKKFESKSHENFHISESQKEFIKEKCLKISQEFDFDKVLKFKGNNNESYSLFHNYNVLKTLYFFDKEFGISYPQDFYLNTLRYCNVGELANNDANLFDFIKEKVNVVDVFNQKVITNINEGKLDYFSLRTHIDYALENKLEKTYPKIEKFILNEGYSTRDFMERFIKLIPDKVSFLKKCCANVDSYLCWSAIKVLQNEGKELEFIKNIAENYLQSEKTNYIANALNVLFYLNSENALQKYHEAVYRKEVQNDLSKPHGYSIESLANYSNLNELQYLDPFFEKFYDQKNVDFDYHYSKAFFNNLIVNLSKTKKGFESIEAILLQIKNQYETDESRLFYINHLIEDSQNSYYESLDKPLSLEQAKLLIKNIENPSELKIKIMGDQFNFGENSNFSGNQFGGKGNIQTNYFNAYTSNQDIEKIQNLMKEFNQLQTDNEEWKNIFIEGMKDLIHLKEAENQVEENQSKTNLRKFHDFIVDIGKKTNDWKNLVFLPVEFHDKVPKLMEIGSHLGKILGISNS